MEREKSAHGLLGHLIGALIGAFICGLFTMASCGPHGTVHEGPGWPIVAFGMFIGACLGVLCSDDGFM